MSKFYMVDSSQVQTLTSGGDPQTITLQCKGLTGGKWNKRLHIIQKVETAARGVSPLDHQPETQALTIQQVTINHKRHQISAKGQTIYFREMVRRGKRFPGNAVFGSADTSYIHDTPLTLAPVLPPGQGEGKGASLPGEKRFRSRNEDILNMQISIKLKNPYASDDVATINSIKVELWAEDADDGPEKSPEGGLYLQDQSDFTGQILSIKDVRLSTLLAEGRNTAGTEYQSITATAAGSGVFYQDCLPYHLDFLDAEYQEVLPYNVIDKDEMGDLILLNYPSLDASGVPTLVDYTKLYDVRRDKNTARPYNFNFSGRDTTAIPHIIDAWTA